MQFKLDLVLLNNERDIPINQYTAEEWEREVFFYVYLETR